MIDFDAHTPPSDYSMSPGERWVKITTPGDHFDKVLKVDVSLNLKDTNLDGKTDNAVGKFYATWIDPSDGAPIQINGTIVKFYSGSHTFLMNEPPEPGQPVKTDEEIAEEVNEWVLAHIERTVQGCTQRSKTISTFGNWMV